MDFVATKSSVSDIKYFILFLITGIWTLPLTVRYPAPGLDPSWILGIHIASLEHLQFGRDIFFTYGPFGFLRFPLIFDYSLWISSLLFILFVHFLLITVIFLFLRTYSAQWYHYLGFIPIFLLVLPFYLHFQLLISLSLVLFMLLRSGHPTQYIYLGLVFSGFFLALGSLLKFDLFFNSIYLIVFFMGYSILIQKKRDRGIFLPITYGTSLILLFLIASQQVTNIPFFLHNGYQLTKNYTEAMAYAGPLWQVIIGFVSIALLITLFIHFIRVKKYEYVAFYLLNAFILFSVFKSGFVRHDASHVWGFFSVYLLFFAITAVLYSNSPEERKKKTFLPFLLIILICITLLSLSILITAPTVIAKNVVTEGPLHQDSFRMLYNQTYFDHAVSLARDRLKDGYPLDREFINKIKEYPVDVFPWDNGLVWAYGLNWSPRPMFQSQGVFNDYIDTLNSDHFTSSYPPHMIIISYKSVDGRYPAFDEPRSFRTLLHHYSFENKSGEFILLSRIPRWDIEDSVDLGSEIGGMGEWIQLPPYKGEIFGAIEIGYSPLGSIMNIIYKPDPVFIKFRLKNGQITKKYRVIPGVITNGVFLSQYIGDTDTLSWVFQGNRINNVESFLIETDHPEYYLPEYSVRFTGDRWILPVTGSILFDHPLEPERVVSQQSDVVYSFKDIAGEIRPSFFEHSMKGGSRIIIRNVTIREGNKLKVAIGIDPTVWDSGTGDGIEYQIFIDSVSPENRIFSEYIDTVYNPKDRRWNSFEIDIGRYNSKDATFIFSTFPGPLNDTSYDWAWWGGLEIVAS